MILFLVETLDFDRPDIRSRAWLPARLLRRAGLPARLVVGEVAGAVLRTADCVVLTGGAFPRTLAAAQTASAASVPLIFDIGSVDLLRASASDACRRQLAEIVAMADLVTAGSETLACQIKEVLGVDRIAAAPDPIDIDDGLAAGLRYHPAATIRTIGTWIDAAARDGFAKLRRRRSVEPGRKRIVWFGPAREPNGEGGVAELLLAASDLADLAAEVPIQLDIVGRSPRAARRFLKSLAVPITFHRYAPWRVRQRLRQAHLCLLPAGGDTMSLARSSGRARLAAALGVPVVAAATTTSLLPAMRAALSERGVGPRRTREDQDARITTTAWRQAIQSAGARGTRRPAGPIASRSQSKLRVLLLLQQFQDIDLIVPVAETASVDSDLEIRVAVLSKIAVTASRRLRAVCRNGGKIEFWYGADLLEGRIEANRFAADVAITASEGPGFGARFARAFVAASRAAGARVLTLQHGLDNGGLTYGPAIPGNAFMADLILTWGGKHRLTDAASPEIKERVVPVGCPKRVFASGDFPDFPLAGRPFIAVFENLHWRRYDDSHRTRFVGDLASTAESAPDLQFVVKPHMGGQWFTRQGSASPLPPNVEIADPAAQRWRRFTADAFLAHASAVVTTPSTIAVDAARYGLPVALVTYGLAANNYMPLPRLERAEDWLAFIEQTRRGTYDRTKLAAFFADAVLPGDAAARILTVIRMAGTRRPRADVLSALHDASHCLAAS
jgi:hypothetical protein